MNQLRKSFEKRRPEPELFESQTTNTMQETQSKKLRQHPQGFSEAKLNLKSQGSEASQPSRKIEKDKPHFKSLNQLRGFVNIKSEKDLNDRVDDYEIQNQQQNNATTSEDYDPVGSQEWQLLDDVESNKNLGGSTTPQSAAARPHQSHMVVKNLIITNANLQNCNVFIQNGGVGDKTETQTRNIRGV